MLLKYKDIILSDNCRYSSRRRFGLTANMAALSAISIYKEPRTTRLSPVYYR